jgi:hypothetical protein
MGKFNSRFNAVKHGLASKKMVLIPGDSDAIYRTLLLRMMFEYDPQTASQRQLVEQLANRFFALRRVPTFEAGVFYVRMCELNIGETPEWDDEIPAVRAAKECFLYGLMLIREAQTGNVLATLNRYETHLLNSIKKIQKMLEESGCTAKALEQTTGA